MTLYSVTRRARPILTRLQAPLVALALATALACSGSGSPTAPSDDDFSGGSGGVDGSFTGWMDTSNWNRVIMDALLDQEGAQVTGTWRAASATGLGWTGTFTGTVSGNTFTGASTISMANPNGDGSTCTGSTSPVIGNASGTLNWSAPGFTGDCEGMPAGLNWMFNRRSE